MSIRVDTSSWISGAIVCGDRGLGVLADDLPNDGDSGGSYLFNDVTLPADSGKEICGRITTWPSAGTLYAYEDGSFEFFDASDGIYSFQYQLYVDGVASGTGTVALQVGASTVTISATTDSATISGAAGCGAAVSIDTIADDSIFAGAAGCGAAASIGAITQSSAFSGSAVSIPLSSGLISATTSAVVFSGAAFAEAHMVISAAVHDAVFSGSAVVLLPAEFLISAGTENATFNGVAGGGYMPASPGSGYTRKQVATKRPVQRNTQRR